MRTTLKRGFGRAAATGNGRPLLPPGPLTPVSRYRQPPPPPRSGLQLVGRILFWVALAVLMLAAALAGGAYLFFHESVAATHPHSRDLTEAASYLEKKVPPPGHAAIALVIGYDHRAGEGNAPSRSDTIMLLRADPQTKSVSMLSFPRDMRVDIHCPGRLVFRDKINLAYATCGSKGTLETVKALTGLPINYLITVNFRGFKQVVNTLGGVWIDVDRRYFNDNSRLSPGFGYAKINLMPGYQQLTGGSALDFVRYRHTDSDFYRVARQQLFITAMREQFRREFSVTKIPKLLNRITRNVEVAPALSGRTVLSYVLFLYHLPSGHFFQARINGLSGYADLTTSTSNIEQAVQDFSAPDVEAPKVATAVALGRKIRTAARKPEQTTIVVLNGNNVPGSASTAGYLLGQRGYKILSPPSGATGNAPSFGYFHTKVYFSPREKGLKAAAQAVAKLFGAADVEWVPRIIRPLSSGAMLTVVVGQTFHGKIAQPPAQRTLTRQPARVHYAKDVTQAPVRSVQEKVPFKLEVPTVIESSSILDPGLPVRVYRIEGKHTGVRLTFRTGGRQYWGIQQTDWQDAPVFDDRNFRHVLGGRRFDFYYRGSRLHMVVLHENGATYWVVNSLLDDLSNETMIAIATGFRPLGRK